MQTVGRLLSIMEILSSSSGMRLREIVKETGLNKSTAHRFLKTLIAQDYVYQNSSNETYHITFKITKLSQSLLNNFNITAFIREHLEILSREVEETLHFTMFNQNAIVYLDKIEANHKGIMISSYIGKTQPLYSTASGKIFLAHLSKIEFDNTWKSLFLQAKTPKTITDKNKMVEETLLIRQQEYAIDNQENESGIACISYPIYDFNGDVKYAISVTIPLFTLNDDINTKLISFIPSLKKCCDNVSKKLGYVKANK